MIQITSLSKSFITPQWSSDIFKWLDLMLGNWDFVAIIWPSGSWKSTLLNLLSWIDREYQWKISIAGSDISHYSDSDMTSFRGKNISYIFQNFRLIENLTVEENIDLVVDINWLDRNFETHEILQLVWLSDKAKSYAFNLSGGESQRVAIARAFVWKTSLLLADEPTWALDVDNKQIVMDLIVKLHKKVWNTIVMITHDDDVAKLTKDIYKLKGKNLEKIV